MSEWYDNRSAEVVLRQPRSWSNERKCLDKCLKRLKPRERALILQVCGDKRERNDLAVFLKVPVAQLKKIRSRLARCLTKCVKEVEENAL